MSAKWLQHIIKIIAIWIELIHTLQGELQDLQGQLQEVTTKKSKAPIYIKKWEIIRFWNNATFGHTCPMFVKKSCYLKLLFSGIFCVWFRKKVTIRDKWIPISLRNNILEQRDFGQTDPLVGQKSRCSELLFSATFCVWFRTKLIIRDKSVAIS